MSHTGIPGNEEADTLALHGADVDNKEQWWKRPFVLADWGRSEFVRGLGGTYIDLVEDDVVEIDKRIPAEELLNDLPGERRMNEGYLVPSLGKFTR